MHEINCMRHQLSQALYYAKRARLVLSYADENLLRPELGRAQDSLTNAMRCEAVVYNHFRLYKAALNLLGQAEHSAAAAAAPEVWLPHLYRDRLLALGQMRRSALSEAERLAHQGADWAERHGDPDAELLAVLLYKGLITAYLHHNHVDAAAHLGRGLVEQVAQLPRVGPMHQVQVRMAHAETLWRAHRLDDWEAEVAAIIQVAAAAELTFALVRLHTHYGRAVEPLLAQLDGDLAHKYRVTTLANA
jgi:hypothetical protein